MKHHASCLDVQLQLMVKLKIVIIMLSVVYWDKLNYRLLSLGVSLTNLMITHKHGKLTIAMIDQMILSVVHELMITM